MQDWLANYDRHYEPKQNRIFHLVNKLNSLQQLLIKGMLLQSYQIFAKQVRNISFPIIENKFREFSQQSLNKWLPQYVPKLHEYSLEFDQHKREEEKMKNVPSFDGKKSYENNQNLHRRIITIFKDFLASQYKDLREYLRLTINVDQLSTILSKVQILRFKNTQFNLIYYLFITGRKSMRLYLKLREQILKTSTFQKNKFLPISTHNKAKYVDKYNYLDTIHVPSVQWKEIVNLAGYEYDEELTKIIFNNRPTITAVQIIEFCLWLNRQYASANTSPSKFG